MIRSNDFYNDLNIPNPHELDEEVEEVCRKLDEEVDKKKKYLHHYQKGNLPKIPGRPLSPDKKYRIYSFSIRRTCRDNSIKYNTIAENGTLAIKNIECVFNMSIGDMFYLSPISVSKPDYPNNLTLGGISNEVK